MRQGIERLSAVFLGALTLLTGLSTSGWAGEGAVEALKQGRTLSCAPAYEVFCANIHFACSGHSEIPTRDLSIAVREGVAALTPSDPGADDPGAEEQGAPRSGPAVYGEDNGYFLVRFEPEGDYFKVEADGRYSHRIYRQGRALMTRGTCQ